MPVPMARFLQQSASSWIFNLRRAVQSLVVKKVPSLVKGTLYQTFKETTKRPSQQRERDHWMPTLEYHAEAETKPEVPGLAWLTKHRL